MFYCCKWDTFFVFADGYAIAYEQIGGSKPFPGRKHSIAPRFGYALSVAHGASSPRVRAFHRVVGLTRRALRYV